MYVFMRDFSTNFHHRYPIISFKGHCVLTISPIIGVNAIVGVGATIGARVLGLVTNCLDILQQWQTRHDASCQI
jgi:hypothetical protein